MSNNCLVHIDLKGAPFRTQYWKELIPYLSKLGVNGLLIEYEDMFPYEDSLSSIVCENVYNCEEIETIISVANQHNLRIIPLIQTFGHLEFVLKHKLFSDLREVQTYPNSICPSNERTLEVVKEMVRQMVCLHQKFTKLEAIHIGCDEVWHLGCCLECKKHLETPGANKYKLFTNFVSKIATFVRKSFGIKVIIWDDMLRNADILSIADNHFNELVEPMVWHYLDYNSFQLNDENFWSKYKQLFKHIWIASAFKGASKMNQMIPPIGYHISNHLAWNQVIRNNQIPIEGIALTGWQRFDHLTTLCELFPNGIVSLLMCLFAFREQNIEFNAETHQKVSQFIGCKQLFPIEFKSVNDIELIDPDLYPGATLFKLCLEWMLVLNEFNEFRSNQRFKWILTIIMSFITKVNTDNTDSASLEGAFTPYQIERNRTNPLHIQSFLLKARILLFRMTEIKSKLESEMKKIFYESTIDEWIQTNVNPILKKVDKIVGKADQQIANHEMAFNSSKS